MKQYLFNFKCLVVLSCLLYSSSIVRAQQMEMHNMVIKNKNIYIAMMDTMMDKMVHCTNSGFVEDDFITQMIPHHEGAVEMAKYEIQHGRSFEMIQLAKSILTEQTSEIEQMRLWLEKYSPVTRELPQFQQAMNQTMELMMENMPGDGMLTDLDMAFAKVMTPHHQAAIDMAKVVIRFSKDGQTNAFAKHIISSQQIEIEQMKSFTNN